MPDKHFISVIDDDESVRLSLEVLMNSLGHAVRTFATAEEFLDAKAAERSACIISDIRLPGISGLDLVDRLKRTGVRAPLILMTSFADEATRARAERAGAQFLSKPLDSSALVACLKRSLGV